MLDHMRLSIPSKRCVSNVIWFMKGKSEISIARKFKARLRHFNGEAFWARGYFLSIVGFDKNMVREYIRNQEKNDASRD